MTVMTTVTVGQQNRPGTVARPEMPEQYWAVSSSPTGLSGCAGQRTIVGNSSLLRKADDSFQEVLSKRPLHFWGFHLHQRDPQKSSEPDGSNTCPSGSRCGGRDGIYTSTKSPGSRPWRPGKWSTIRLDAAQAQRAGVQLPRPPMKTSSGAHAGR